MNITTHLSLNITNYQYKLKLKIQNTIALLLKTQWNILNMYLKNVIPSNINQCHNYY